MPIAKYLDHLQKSVDRLDATIAKVPDFNVAETLGTELRNIVSSTRPDLPVIKSAASLIKTANKRDLAAENFDSENIQGKLIMDLLLGLAAMTNAS